MSLSTLDYLNLSAVAYLDFDKLSIGKNIAQLIKDEAIPKNDLNKKSELSALKSSSNPLRSYILLDYTSTLSGFRGAAFQNPKTGEIIFSFKGTDFDPSNPKTYTDTAKDITNTDGQIFTGSSNYVNENGFIGNTWNRLRGAILCSL
jgi:hypothetical protein